MRVRARHAAILLPFLWIPGVAAQDKAPPCDGTTAGGAFAGVDYGLTERAHDGQFPVCDDRKTAVDANSDLVVHFDVPVRGGADTAAGTEEQRRLVAALAAIDSLQRDVARLDPAHVDLNDTAAVRQFQEAVQAVGQRVSQAVDQLISLGLTQKEIITIANQPGGAYVGLARRLRERIAATQERITLFLASRDSFVVQVAAYKDPLRGKRASLHVQDYDELPLGELQPIDRYGLQLTPAEQERLHTELAGNQQIAASIGTIVEHADSIRREMRAAVQRLAVAAGKIDAALSAPLKTWMIRLDEGAAKLEKLRHDNPTGPVATTLQSLGAEWQGIRRDVSLADSVVIRLNGVAALVRSPPSDRDFADLVAGQGGILQLLGGIQGDLPKLQSALADVGLRAGRVLTLVDKLPTAIATELRASVTLADVDGVVTSLQAELPLTLEVVRLLAPYLQLAADRVPAADILEDVSHTTFRRLDDLPDAVVELDRAAWTLGDEVTLVVRFLERGNGEAGQQASRVSHQTTYRVRAVLTGGHREISSAVIFARAIDGSTTQREWKPNVAAMVSWHHWYRSAKGIRRVWNSLDPAVGLHLASLDQTSDNIEFGLGAQLTFWQGLVTGGYGYNLSRSTKGSYAFVGLNLYDLLSSSLH
jgi:hypothetical protein